MLRTLGKTVGGTLAMLCLVSTLAVAASVATARICTTTDGKGNCTAAIGTDGKVVLVIGEGGKVGDRVTCVDRDYGIFWL